MTSYKTCINCAADKNVCTRRSAVQAAIKGAGITSVKFRCADRMPMFHAGQRVGVTWPVYDSYEDANLETWPATIVSESGTRFLVAVDDADSDEGTPARSFIKNERLFVKVSPSRIQPLEEPDREICKFCQRAPLPGSHCPERADVWPVPGFPPGCIAGQEAKIAAVQHLREAAFHASEGGEHLGALGLLEPDEIVAIQEALNLINRVAEAHTTRRPGVQAVLPMGAGE